MTALSPVRPTTGASMRRLALLLTASVLVAGCSGGSGGLINGGDESPAAATPSTVDGSQTPAGDGDGTPTTSYAVAKPGKFDGRTNTPDLLITGSEPLSDALIARIEAVRIGGTKGVEAVLPL